MDAPTPTRGADLARRHLRLGWWSLLVFLTLGIVLEGLHGFKVAAYLDVGNETRRMLWRLAHAHGTLLSLLHLVFGVYVRGLEAPASLSRASAALTVAGVLLPAGFFLGGVVTHGGDPGLGILLVPLGAVALFAGVLITARSTARS